MIHNTFLQNSIRVKTYLYILYVFLTYSFRMYSITNANDIIMNIIIKTIPVCICCSCVFCVSYWIKCTVLCEPKMNSRCQQVTTDSAIQSGNIHVSTWVLVLVFQSETNTDVSKVLLQLSQVWLRPLLCECFRAEETNSCQFDSGMFSRWCWM